VNLKKRIERLEQQTAILVEMRDQQVYGSKSEEELLFLITHGYFPEGAACCKEPEIHQLEYAGFRATILLERATCTFRQVEVCTTEQTTGESS
jgi:hypothetical protein